MEEDFSARKVFHKNFKHLLIVSGLSQNKLAREIGVAQSKISNWIARETIPCNDLDKLADIFQVEVCDFFDKNIEFKRGNIITIRKEIN